MVSGSDYITTIRFKMIKEGQDHIGGKMLYSERGDLYGKFVSHKG